MVMDYLKCIMQETTLYRIIVQQNTHNLIYHQMNNFYIMP